MSNIINPLEELLNTPESPDVPTFKWGTIQELIGSSFVKVKLDNDETALTLNNPDKLVRVLEVGDRVFVLRHKKRLVILGVAGGEANPVPMGGLIPFTIPSAAYIPLGFVIADGRAISRTTYSRYFEAVGTIYGPGNGTTTFNVPNIQGRTIYGRNQLEPEFDYIGKTGGTKTHTLTESEMPSHNHPSGGATNFITTSRDVLAKRVGTTWSSGAWVLTVADVDIVTNVPNTGNRGGNGAHNNLSPYIALPYLIKVI